MKNGWAIVLAVELALAATCASAGTTATQREPREATERPALKVIGPVEAYNPQTGVARVLGQTVVMARNFNIAVGDVASVKGLSQDGGVVVATAVVNRGAYVAGASPIYLSGTVQKVNSAVGTATVNGVGVDFTALMANGSVEP